MRQSEKEVTQQVAIRHSRTEPCGCVVTEVPGYKHMRMCPVHAVEYIRAKGVEPLPANNLDLIGG